MINRIEFQTIVCLSLLISSCGNKNTENQKNNPMVFTDMSNREVTIPAHIKRVISNGPPGTIMLYTLAEDMLIARNFKASESEVHFCVENYCNLPHIGRWFLTSGSRNTEILIKLNPDVIISCGNTDATAVDFADKDQKFLGIPVLQFSTNFQELDNTYKMLGKLLDKQQKAEEISAFINKYLLPIVNHANRIPENQKLRIYLAIGDKGLTSSPTGSIHAQVFDYAGAKNVVRTDKPEGHVNVTIEQIIEWNPDIILTCGYGSITSSGLKQYIQKSELWKGIDAVKHGLIYPVPMEPYCWIDLPPSVNQILGVIWLSYLLYPDWFPFNIEKITREFYSVFYHYNMGKSEAIKLIGVNRELN